ncbi:SET domain protein [Metarhizium album ARSEF 1941]|uniref:SET domain protein n=1 Tax=Metarhizium album (strain ARSEF 1941) TaxID=1081103 RepID=A0A0B2WPL3_METAS|nr:SET domain protein [Metarhizium album ARSEF 1941]KHN94930.1 SET domain protein [Metarhizium album ARSEF 1941]
MTSEDFTAKTAAFMQWFKALPGAAFSNSIEIADLRCRDAGRGIIALVDIPADTALFTIPRRAIIDSDTSSLREKLPNLFESQGDEDEEQALDPWSALILIMMYEVFLGDRSKWKPYIDVLPLEFDTPMFWSEEELSHLQASATVNKIGKVVAEEMFRTRLIPAIRGNPSLFVNSSECSDDDLIRLAHRMGSTIMAYAFDLESEEADDDDGSDGWVEDREGKSMMGMIAMADILNADAEFNAHVNHGDDELTVTSIRDIKAGEEILNYYGPHPNSELLRRYGYVTQKHSRYDVVEIPWDAVQHSLMSELGVPRDVMAETMGEMDQDDLEDVFVLERDSGEPNPDGTFAGPAVVDGMPAGLKEQLKSTLKLLQKLDRNLISDKRKRDDILRSTMAATLRLLASRYSTTAAEDEVLLAQGHLSRRQRMAIQVRLGEKRLIQEACDHFSEKASQETPETGFTAAKKAKRSE